MIAHTMIAVSDYAAAKEFYSKALASIGYKLAMDLAEYEVVGFMEGGQTSFWIARKDNPQPNHIAFLAKNKGEVEAFHKAALDAGGKDNGAPGYRKEYSAGYYAAFIHDADGNNVEAVWYDPAPNA